MPKIFSPAPLASQLGTTVRQRLLHPLFLIALVGGSVALAAVAVTTDLPDAPTNLFMSSVALSAPSQALIGSEDLSLKQSITILSKDTLASALARASVLDERFLQFLVTSPEARSLTRRLRPGSILDLQTDRNGTLLSLSLPLPERAEAIRVLRVDTGFLVEVVPLGLDSEVRSAYGQITSSLFAATDAAGLPEQVATELAEIFGSKLDFRRDLRRGDTFSVVYEASTYEGTTVKSGRILAAELRNNGRQLRAYWYASSDMQGDYFDEDGSPIRQGFLRSPLEFSRVTSGFSLRMHPILQQWRAHKGVDFGAPVGAKVKASAQGVVSFAGTQGGYGKFIVLQHPGGISTAYAHLNGFAPGVRAGKRVSQGEVIGFVGQTGWATGPHLHYEFRVNGMQQNPLAVALPPLPPLAGPQLQAFRIQTRGAQERLVLASQQSIALKQ